MTKGAEIKTGDEAPIETSNRMTLEQIPVGTQVYAIELVPGKGAQMVRAAGATAQLMAKENGYATLRMPSGEVRKVLTACSANIGVVGNVQHQNIKIGSAGRKRRKGIRPTVNTVAPSGTSGISGVGSGSIMPSTRPL